MFAIISKLLRGIFYVFKVIFILDRESPLMIEAIIRRQVPLRKLICYMGIFNVIGCMTMITLLCLCPGYITASKWGEDDDFQTRDDVSSFFHASILHGGCSIILTLIFVYEAYLSKSEWTQRYLTFAYANGFTIGPTYLIFTIILYFFPIRRNSEMHKYILEVVISSAINMTFLQVVDHCMAEEDEKMFAEEDKMNAEKDNSLTTQLNTTSDDVSKNPEMSIRKRQRDNDDKEDCITES